MAEGSILDIYEKVFKAAGIPIDILDTGNRPTRGPGDQLNYYLQNPAEGSMDMEMAGLRKKIQREVAAGRKPSETDTKRLAELANFSQSKVWVDPDFDPFALGTSDGGGGSSGPSYLDSLNTLANVYGTAVAMGAQKSDAANASIQRWIEMLPGMTDPEYTPGFGPGGWASQLYSGLNINPRDYKSKKIEGPDPFGPSNAFDEGLQQALAAIFGLVGQFGGGGGGGAAPMPAAAAPVEGIEEDPVYQTYMTNLPDDIRARLQSVPEGWATGPTADAPKPPKKKGTTDKVFDAGIDLASFVLSQIMGASTTPRKTEPAPVTEVPWYSTPFTTPFNRPPEVADWNTAPFYANPGVSRRW